VLVVRVLGELALEADGEPCDPPARRHGQLLLAYLALHPGLHGRGELARLLWPDVLESSARSSLRSALSSVRRAIGDRHLLDPRGRLGLADDVTVDVREFHALVEAGRLEEAVERGRGTLLQGLEADWIDQARERHGEQVGEALGALAAAAEARGDLAAAARLTREQVALDPLAEPPNRELIRRLAAAGDRAAALAAYARLSDAFRTQLRSIPSRATRELVARVRAADEGAPAGRWAPLELPATLRSRVPAVLAGRDAELGELRAALEQARAGSGQIALVAGEPGIGKTALLARFAQDVAPEVTVLCGRGGLIDALRHYADAAPAERATRELPAGTAQLVALVPGLARAFEPPDASADLQLGEAGRLTRLVVDALLALAAHHPLVVLVDELESGDPTGLRALAHLAAASESARLLVVAAYRDTEAARLEATLRVLRRLESTRMLVVGPLDREAVAAMAGGALSRELAEALHRRSGGHPLFAQELARRGPDSLDAPLPERVSDLILDELSRLSPATRRVLATASAVGDEFDLAVLTRAMDATPEALLDALDDAVGARAVRELPGRVGRYEFRHPLIRETLYATLTATRRAHLHLRIAQALEGGSERELAEHLLRAGELVPAPQLAESTLRAARACEAALAYDDAALLYERALALADGPAERGRLLLALGHARRRAGATEGVREAFTEAAELDPELLPDAALGLCAAPDFASGHAVDAAAVAMLERALAALPSDADALRARLLAQLAFARYGGGDHEIVAGLVARAAELARAGGDPAALSAALDAAHMIRRGGGDPRERLGIVDELLAVARTPEQAALAHVRRAADLFELGDFAGVRAEREALTTLAAGLRQPAYLWWAALWRSTEAIFTGAPEAERFAREAYAAGRASVGAAADLELGAQTFWLHLEHDRLGEHVDALYAAFERYAALPAARCALARLDAEAGRLDAAARALARLTGPELASIRREAGWPIAAALLSEVCARVGDADAAQRLRAQLEPIADRWATSAYGSLCLGPLAGSLALVCATAGGWDDAERHRHHALAACSATGAAPAAARLEREYAHLAATATLAHDAP